MVTPDELAGLIKQYQPGSHAVDILASTPVVLMVGISGAGKGTVLEALVETGQFYRVITHTTRQPRYNNGRLERDGVDYHFVDTEQFAALLRDQKFIEADAHMGGAYGSSVAELETAAREGKTAIMDIDVNGVESYMALTTHVLPIFLVPPSYDTWITRLKNRFTDGWYQHRDDIARRTQRAAYEIDTVVGHGYYHLVVNDRLEDTIAAVKAIVAGVPQTTGELEHATRVMNDIKTQVSSGTLDD